MKQTLNRSYCLLLFVLIFSRYSYAQLNFNLSQSLDSLLKGNSTINLSISNFVLKTSFVETDSTANLKSMGASFKLPDFFAFYVGNLSISGLPQLIQKPQLSLSNSITHSGIILNPITFQLTNSGHYNKTGLIFTFPFGLCSLYAERFNHEESHLWFLQHFNFNISGIASSISFILDYTSTQNSYSSWYTKDLHFNKAEKLYPSVIFSVKSKYFFLSLWGLAQYCNGISLNTAFKTEFSLQLKSFNLSCASYNESKKYIASKNATQFPLQYALSLKHIFLRKNPDLYTLGLEFKNMVELKPEQEWYKPYTENKYYTFNVFFYLFDSELYYSLKIQNNEFSHSYKLVFLELMQNRAQLSLKLDKTISTDTYTMLFSMKPHKKFRFNSQLCAKPNNEIILYIIENQYTYTYSINSCRGVLQLETKHKNEARPAYFKISNTIMY